MLCSGGQEYKELHIRQVHLYSRFPCSDDATESNQPHGVEEGLAEGSPYHRFDSDMLRFLRWSSCVDREVALRYCERASPPLFNEMVEIMGAMGNTRAALNLLLENVCDVRRAIEFVEVGVFARPCQISLHVEISPLFFGGSGARQGALG